MDKIRVLVLMGGVSNERDISLLTGDQVINALSEVSDVEVIPVEVSPSGQWQMGRNIDEFARGSLLELPSSRSDKNLKITGALSKGSLRIDIALILLHGKYGEDGAMAGLLEMANIIYVGSKVLASALSIDKYRSSIIFRSFGLSTPANIAYLQQDDPIPDKINFPVVVKPNNGGSSIGIAICKQGEEMLLAIKEAFKFDTEVILEECLKGREYTCGVIDYLGKPIALPVIEIVPPKDEFYDYKNKYDANGAKHIVPAKITQKLTKEIQSAALLAHKSLGCLDMSRSDFIVKDGKVYIIELNTIPGMTPVSLFPEAAKAAGIELPDLLKNIIMSAYHREVKNG